MKDVFLAHGFGALAHRGGEGRVENLSYRQGDHSEELIHNAVNRKMKKACNWEAGMSSQ